MQGETPTYVPKAEGWSEPLASVSEAVVKAEQLVDCDAAADPAKLQVLQRQSVEVIRQLHHVEDGAAPPPKRSEHDVLSPAHQANLDHTKRTAGHATPQSQK